MTASVRISGVWIPERINIDELFAGFEKEDCFGFCNFEVEVVPGEEVGIVNCVM